MRKFLMYAAAALSLLWQLPQLAVGFVVLFVRHGSERKEVNVGGTAISYYVAAIPAGVCLGEIIIIGEQVHRNFALGIEGVHTYLTRIRHEAGHRAQSRMLGWLYLPVIGLPSLLGNLYSRIFRKGSAWYYRQPWEAWADRLGGVSR